MEPVIKTYPAFRAVGIKYRGQNKNGEIPQLWEQLMPKSGAIQQRTTPETAYGVMHNYDMATGAFDYLAGYGVEKSAAVPEGMLSWDVPAHQYAVFTTTLKTIQETFHYISEQWLPKSSYHRANAPEFELYDEHFSGPDSPVYIYIPIE